jgi:hypothetical protein
MGWPNYLARFLHGLDTWMTIVLWPRNGHWPTPEQSEPRDFGEIVRCVILRGAGLPSGWAGAIRFSKEEEPIVLAALFSFLVFGWCENDDVYVIPDHGRQMLLVSHHDEVQVIVPNKEQLIAFESYWQSETRKEKGDVAPG